VGAVGLEASYARRSGGEAVTDDLTRRFDQLADVTKRLAALGVETCALSALRRELVQNLSTEGFSHSQIAEAAGLSRGRIFQILQGARTWQS
jgi:DNA-directed RNA polymerase specialized sigma24 family protein